MEQSEQLQSEREDSTVEILRMREEIGENIQELTDKESELSRLTEEISSIRTLIQSKEIELEKMEAKHRIWFHETI